MIFVQVSGEMFFLNSFVFFHNPSLIPGAVLLLKFLFSKKAIKIDKIFTINLKLNTLSSNRKWDNN